MRTKTLKKGTFLWSRWDSNPRTTPDTCFFGGPRLYRLSYDSVWIGHNKNNCFFNSFYLTTRLMIRTTTDLVPSRFLAYNPLFEALTGFMVIAYIIVIGKLILKVLQGASTGFGFQVQQGIIATTLAVDGLQGLGIGHHVLPMLDNPFSQRGGLHVRFQGQGITV